MYQPKQQPDIRCPLEYGLRVFGGKWKSRVICVLANRGTMRYSELREALINVTDTVLATTLRELKEDSMIERIQYNEIPPHTEYCLTERGKSVVPVLISICQWAGTTSKETPARCLTCDYTCDVPGLRSRDK